MQISSNNTNNNVPSGALQTVDINPTSSQNCFSFYYYIHGVNVYKLELYLIPKNGQAQLIWTRASAAGDMWHTYMVNIPTQSAAFKVC